MTSVSSSFFSNLLVPTKIEKKINKSRERENRGGRQIGPEIFQISRERESKISLFQRKVVREREKRVVLFVLLLIKRCRHLRHWLIQVKCVESNRGINLHFKALILNLFTHLVRVFFWYLAVFEFHFTSKHYPSDLERNGWYRHRYDPQTPFSIRQTASAAPILQWQCQTSRCSSDFSLLSDPHDQTTASGS